MAITEYAYQKATWAQLLKCLKWALRELQMRDWEISLVDCDLSGKDYGDAFGDIYCLKGTIHLDILYCKRNNQNVYSTLLHETLHLFLQGKLRNSLHDDEDAVRALEPILYEKFCLCNKIKKARKLC